MSAALSLLAELLYRVADGTLDVLEILISDLAGKRPRRSHRIVTRRVYRRPRPVVYHVHYHQSLRPVRTPYAAQ